MSIPHIEQWLCLSCGHHWDDAPEDMTVGNACPECDSPRVRPPVVWRLEDFLDDDDDGEPVESLLTPAECKALVRWGNYSKTIEVPSPKGED